MTLKIAIVGTGNVARRSYLPFLATQKDVSLTYYNRTREKAEACAAQFGGRVAASVEDLMADGPDAVLVLTAETARYEMALKVLDHKPRRIFFEKPLVAQQGQAHVAEEDFEKGREVLRRARAVGAETAMIFNYRFFDQTLKARQIVSKRGFGRPILVAGLVHYACWSHAIDLIHAFAGPVAEMTALPGGAERVQGKMQARDLGSAFTTVGGATGTVLGTCGISFAFPLFELQIGFEGGRIAFRGLDGDMETLDYRGTHHETYSLTRGTSQWDQYARSFEKSVGAYLESIRTHAGPPVPGLEGLRELQFEAAQRRSIRCRRPVDVQTEFPLE